MTFDTPHADSQNHRLADALDRLAGVLERQARELEALRAEVGALGDAVRRVETRLQEPEKPGPAAEGTKPKAAKGPGKKRGG